MVVLINGTKLKNWNQVIDETKTQIGNNMKLNILEINKFDYTKLLYAGAAVTVGDFTQLDEGLNIIIDLLKRFSYYVGIGYGIWGGIEYSMDNPTGVDKMKRAFIGFIAVNLIPILFSAIRTALT